MTRHEIHNTLKIPFSKRISQGLQIFDWEHCSKKFYEISNELAINHLLEMSEDISKKEDDPMILKCECNGKTYYFGVGLKECENITLKKLRKLYNHATWYVYTWAD